MLANDSLLFIDSNKYLDLYRTDQGRMLLASLREQVDYIFITEQVVNEVQRNKISVAVDFLKKKSKELKLQNFNLPDHLLSTSIEQRNSILQKRREVNEKIKDMNAEIDALFSSIIEQISCSEDEVSKALSLIFANAIPHSSEELQRARNRKEMGNPPGKITNPLGDQLTWEQILTHFKEKKRLWIISKDGDYGTVYGNKGFLNRFLYDELCKITPNPEVYLFDSTVTGINHFVDTTGVKAEQRLTSEEAKEIEREEKALPNLNSSIESISRILQNMEQLSQPGDSFQKSLENIRSIRNIGLINYEFPNILGELQQSLAKAHRFIENVQEDMNESTQSLLPSTEDNKNDGENE